MADSKHLKILKKGVETWNKWRRENPEIRPDLRGADLSYANLSRADLSYTNLSLVDLISVNLRDANLSYANLFGANLRDANLRESNLRDAKLKSANLIRANLYGANLSGADLRNADLIAANLNGTHLIDANLFISQLRSADLSGADLNGASFSDANLRNSTLVGADLSGADLSGTYLWDATLSRVKLQNADFTGARLDNTIFVDSDLSRAIGLDFVRHRGPSSIGIDTLYKSAGNIPESFLRGCGLKDWEIEATRLYQANLTPGQASEILYKVHELRTNPTIQFHSCFISYSSKNQLFAERLYADLQSQGVRCWFAPEDLKIGEKIRVGIDESIRMHDKLLLVLSKHSVESEWVEKEVETAMEQERKQKRTVLFPVMLDNSVMKLESGWPADIRRSRNIGDFRKWKDHDLYQKAFNRLLRDLKAGEHNKI